LSEALAVDPITALVERSTPDPYPVYARLREAGPALWSERIGSWVLGRHRECTAVLRDSASFASDWRRVGEELPEPLLSIQALDPPEHTRIRHFMVDAVRAIDHDALEKQIAERVRARASALRGRSDFDYISELAEPLALEIITAVLGVPPLDPEWFLPVSHTIVDGMDAGVWPDAWGPAVKARAELAELAETWLADPPRGGMVGHVAANAADVGISSAVLRNTLRAVLHAGFESAGRLLGLGLVALLDEPGALARFAGGDPSLAAEELVRFTTPVQADSRACVAETRIGDQVIAPGDPVTLLLGAANRDPARFTDPDVLEFTRRPNPHLGFGRGAHSCLGQALAVMQARVVFGLLAIEHPGIRAVSPPDYRRNLTLRGVASFHLTID
jgi:cytochrome P450